MAVQTSIKIKDLVNDLNLKVISGHSKVESQKIRNRGVNRPELELTGYYVASAFGRIVLFGTKENCYIEKISENDAKDRIRKLMESDFPCIVITKNYPLQDWFLKMAKELDFIILESKVASTDTFITINEYLNKYLAPEIEVHATLVEVYGKGVLIKGRSGIGKSETTLELVKKGHFFVGDDRIAIKRIGTRIMGRSVSVIKDMIEVRGIGIIDVRSMFGVSALLDETKIDYVINLKELNSESSFERLGQDIKYMELATAQIPYMDVPVASARNVSSLIEVAVTQLNLKLRGEDAFAVLQKRMEENQ